MAAEHLLIVGKRGVGKSTTASNLAAALAESGKRVLLIGYDTHRNSTASLRGNRELKPLPGWVESTEAPLFAYGYRGSLCIEAGELAADGSTKEAAGLLYQDLVIGYGPDFIIHDVGVEPGGSWRVPAAAEGVLRVLVVTSAEMGAISVVNELSSWLNTVAAVNCRFGGVVVNDLSGPLYESIVSDFVNRAGTAVAAKISHSLMILASEFHYSTVIESAPLSQISYPYRKLARTITAREEFRRPKHLEHEALQEWARKWGEIIHELERGYITDGAHI